VPKMINYQGRYCGSDTPGEVIEAADFYEYPIQDFDYRFNSWGFRGEDFAQYIGEKVNICLGDSMAINIGGPIEHSWCSQLAEHFDIPTLNFGMQAAGNDAIFKVYQSAIKLFDVQNTFVMYGFMHRRLVDGKFEHHTYTDYKEDFAYFIKQRIVGSIECALPVWSWWDEEKQFLSDQGIYFLDVPSVTYFSDYFSDQQPINKKHIIKKSYNNLKGLDWPTLKEFVNGADPHPDMFTKQFGQFMSNRRYKNRDGCHMNYDTNKEYANYLYTQWTKK
jgi:hypothetical protein